MNWYFSVLFVSVRSMVHLFYGQICVTILRYSSLASAFQSLRPRNLGHHACGQRPPQCRPGRLRAGCCALFNLRRSGFVGTGFPSVEGLKLWFRDFCVCVCVRKSPAFGAPSRPGECGGRGFQPFLFCRLLLGRMVRFREVPPCAIITRCLSYH